MKQRLTTLLLLLVAVTATAWAQTGQGSQNALAIYQKDGQVTKFAFTEHPVVTYSGNDVVLTTTKTTVQYPIYMLQKIVFDVEIPATDVKEQDAKPAMQFRFEGGTLIITGGEAGSAVYLYSLSSVMEGEYRLDSNGCASIPLQQLGKSMYIVKTNRVTFKFRKS